MIARMVGVSNQIPELVPQIRNINSLELTEPLGHEGYLETVKSLNDQGMEHYNSGKLEEAAECYSKALALHPDNLVALYTLAVITHQLKRFGDSKDYFEGMVQRLEHWGSDVNPELLAIGHQGIGVALLCLWGGTGSGEPSPDIASKAESEFNRALELNPNYLEAWVGLGVALHILDRLDEAEAAFRRALDIAPHNAAIMGRLRGVLEDKLERRLFELGYLSKMNKPIHDLSPYESRSLIKVKGKPLSEVIIEDRR